MNVSLRTARHIGGAALLSSTGLGGPARICTACAHHWVDDVVVTAAGREQQVKDAPASITVINRETLERAPYRQLTDALLDVPGVTVTPGEGNSRDISIRGLGSAYTLILVDGRRLSTRESRTNGGNNAESGLLPPVEMIERIEVVRGPMSSLYGSDAMGGVINVITRRIGDDWSASFRTNGTSQTNSDYGDYYDASVYASGPLIKDVLGLQLSASMNRRSEDDIIYGSPRRKDDSVQAKLGWAINPKHDLLFEGSYYKQESIETAGRTWAVSNTAPAGTRSTETQDRYIAAITHSGDWGWATSRTFIQYEDATLKETDVNIKNTVAETSWIVTLGSNILNLGGSYNYADLYAPWGNGLTINGKVRDAADRTQWALFAEDEWTISDSLALTAGVRMDDHDLYGSQFSPRLYAVWKPTHQLIVKGGVSTGFPAPDIRQTLADWGQHSRGGTIYGNPDLEAETTVTYEGIVIYTVSPHLEIGLTAYQTDFEDKILRVTCAQAMAWCIDQPLSSIGRPPTTYVNIDEARIKGLEATLDVGATYRVNETLDARAGIQNLFDHNFTYKEYGYVNDRARVWAGLTAHF